MQKSLFLKALFKVDEKSPETFLQLFSFQYFRTDVRNHLIS